MKQTSFEGFNKYKNTVFELTRKQVKTQYRDSSLGFIWTILNPMLNMLVMWLVFSSFFKRNEFYPIYLLCGNVLFAALRASSIQAMESIVNNRGLLLRTKIKLSVFPLSNVLTSIVNFALSLIALLPFMIWLSIQEGVNLFTYRILFLLLMLPAFVLFEFGVGLFLSVVYVFFRDIKHIYTVFLTLWMYSTPIFYTIDQMHNEVVMQIIRLNPMFHFLNYFRDCIYRGAAGIDLMEKQIGPFLPVWSTLLWVYVFAFIVGFVGIVVFRLFKKKIITRI